MINSKDTDNAGSLEVMALGRGHGSGSVAVMSLGQQRSWPGVSRGHSHGSVEVMALGQ